MIKKITFVILALCSIWPLFDNYTLAADILGQALMQVSFLILLLITLHFILRQWKFALLYGCLLLINLSWLLYATGTKQIMISEKSNGYNNDSIKVLTYNVWKNNQSQTDIIQVIKIVKPDIVWLQEVHKKNYREIVKKSSDYFHYPSLEDASPQGFVLLSKYPINVSRNTPTLSSTHVKLINPLQTIDFIGVHLTSPKTQRRLEERNRQIKELKHYVETNKLTHSIVAGDFNSSPWRPDFIDFSNDLNFLGSFNLKNIYTSWPTSLPEYFGVPIDYSYFSSLFCSIETRTISLSGSDHLPILTEAKICFKNKSSNHVESNVN